MNKQATITGTDSTGTKERAYAVLPIPMDGQRQRRSRDYAMAERPLGDSASRRLNLSVKEGNEAIPAFAAVYFAWIYRLSGETELASDIVAEDGAAIPVFLQAEPGMTFERLADAVRRALGSGGPDAGEEKAGCETRFAYRRSLRPEGELLNGQLLLENGKWLFRIQYDRSLFHASTIDRYIRYYVALLEAALESPSASVAGVDILTEEDEAVYVLTNATERAYDRTQTIHGMVEAMAEKYPERTALATADRELTYRELNGRANRIASMLLELGLRRGDFVTLYMERSPELIVGLLGVLKAGGAYVPVDPEHPEDRNRYIVGDTRSAIVLTNERFAAKAAELCEGLEDIKEIIRIDGDLTVDASVTNVDAGVVPADLAYIIYTSGSTGRPKGALIAHEGVVNLGETVRRDCRIEPGDVLTQFATYSFDASVWDTIGALFYGATLYLLEPEERVSVEAFASAIERTGTTIIAILPTVFFNQLSAYLSEEGYRRLAKVKLITVAGEALYGEQVRAFQRKFKDAIDIVNVYGPTECTVCTTTYTVRGYIPDDIANVPIGRPIGNYKVYIVNEENRLCPIGVPGEVLISTVGLARGYLNQPEKTAEAFVPNPFGPGRIYRSGDIARLLPDGHIEYVGRRDTQIKIRGHRIEIGEIEDAFARLPNVHNVAVLPAKDGEGRNMLIGCFTTVDGTRISPAEIKRRLGEKLPSYFVPKTIAQVERMPLSPTGKIDRRKLAELATRARPETNENVASAENETQERIASAWREALELETVGIRDDFFAVGGDSLAVVHALALLKPYYPNLGINDFYRERTIEALAIRAGQLEERPSAGRSRAANGAPVALNEHPAVLDAKLADRRFEVPRTVLLTGATGYLGSHLLNELLERGVANIVCLVRKRRGLTGRSRLRETMAFYFGEASLDRLEGRVQVMEGELEARGLGLDDAELGRLLGRLDAIVHSAADVRHFGDEGEFAKSNIEGTRQLLDLAERAVRNGRDIRFHHVSTLGIPEDLALSGRWEEVLGTPGLGAELRVDNVYTNSKLEAERLAAAAAKRGLAVTVYRAGNLVGHSGSGRFQRNIDSNAFYRMLKAMLLLGVAPTAQWQVDLTPIDYAAAAIVHLAQRPDTAGRVFHVCNPEPVSYEKLLGYVRRLGYPIAMLDFARYSDWLLDTSAAKNPEGVKLAMAQLDGDGAKDSAYRYGCPEALAYLRTSDVRCAAPDERFFARLVDYAVRVGYFPRPATPVAAARSGARGTAG